MDLSIRNARIVDGSGEPSRPGDVGIQGGRILHVGPVAPPAREELDLDGLMLAPGFLDIHAHSDYLPLLDPEGGSRVFDGVVMEVSGNCGMSPFPLSEEEADHEAAMAGLVVDWRDMEAYLERLRGRGMGLDRAWLVGHGTLRARVMGFADRPATPAELSEMERLLEEHLRAGALGLSTGLIYSPGVFATRDEIQALARVVKRHDRLYASHIRGEGDTLLEAVDEILEVAAVTGVRTQISHLKASKPENWHKLEEAVRRIEDARAEGHDVMADRYPYAATATGLAAVLPEWALDGGKEAAARRLAPGRPERGRILQYLAGKHPDPYWQRVQIASMGGAAGAGVEGRRILEVARERGADPRELALDLLHESRLGAEAVYHVLDEANLERVLSLPWVMVGSDGMARSRSGPTASGRPHPRSFGTFARMLGRYGRERGLFTMEEAVRKMTSMPAERLGLSDRGRVAVGARADLVVLDPATVQDRATFEVPLEYSRGIHWVWIHGECVIREGEHTGARPGVPVLRCTR